MGIDDIAVSFAVSYIAGSIPTLKDWLSRDKDFESRLNECYNRALKKWTVNDGIQDSLSNKMLSHLSELRDYLLTKPTGSHTDIDKLIAMWADELRSDTTCYNFIVENKLDFINSKQDEYYVDLKKSILGQLDTMQQGIESNSEKLDTVQQMMQQLIEMQQSGNEIELVKFLNCMLDTTVKNLINDLHTVTATRILSELEVSCSATISNNPIISEKITTLKQKSTILTKGELKFIQQDVSRINDKIISIPDTLTSENLNEWLQALNLHRFKTGSMVAMSRELVKQDADYNDAFDAADKFYTLLNRTEVAGRFPILRAMYCYWGFLVKEDNIWLAEYQSIDKSTFGDQEYYFQLIEASMLFMAGKSEESFALAASIKDGIDASYVNFLILLGFHSHNIDYTLWALNTAIEKKIKISDDGSKFLAFSSSKETANLLLSVLPQLEFECEAEKEVIIQLCNNSLAHSINTSGFKDKIETLSDTILAYAAMLLALDGDVDYGFKLLNPRIEGGQMDIKQRLFIDILCMSHEHKPHLYRLLQQNRNQGEVNDNQLLFKEFELAMELSDYENALNAIDILYKRDPDNEIIFVNYISALGRVHPEELSIYEEKVISFVFSHTTGIKFIYSAYAENGRLEFATEFLSKNQRSKDDEGLRHFFYTESTMGFICPIVNKEYECAEEGLSVLYSIGEKKEVVIVRPTTPLGGALMNKKKGDVVNFKEVEYHIEGIYSKYYKESSDYMKEVVQYGGNEFMHMMHFDTNHPLESIEALIKEVSPDSANYEERKREALQKYENGEIGLIQLLDDNHIIGNYYKMLFTPFKIHISPIETYANRCSWIKSDTRFVLDLPACIILFEFAQKTGHEYSVRFHVSKYVCEFVKQSKKHIRRDISLDLFEGIRNGNIRRFDEHLDIDCEKRLQALSDWIESNCDIEVTSEALAISKSNEAISSALFSNTMVCLLNSNNCLITDESIFEQLLQGEVPMISTEAFIHQMENEIVAKQYSEFLFECRFEGVRLDHNFIAEEYFKMENGEPNRFNDVIQNGDKNPYMLINAINAGLLIIRKTTKQNLAKISLTNMYSLILTNYNDKYFYSQEWTNIQEQLNCQIPYFISIKEYLDTAVGICKSNKEKPKV